MKIKKCEKSLFTDLKYNYNIIKTICNIVADIRVAYVF